MLANAKTGSTFCTFVIHEGAKSHLVTMLFVTALILENGLEC